MNLKEIRERVEDALTYAPGVESHRIKLNRRINDAQKEILTFRRWTFRQRLFELTLMKERVIANADWSIPSNTRALEFPLPTGWTRLNVDWLAGQTVLLPFAPADSNGTGLHDEFIIESSNLTGAGTTVTIIPDPRYPGLASKAGITDDITLKFLRYRMPASFSEAQGVMDRAEDFGEIRQLDLWRERAFMLNNSDDPGRPVRFLIDPNYPDFVGTDNSGFENRYLGNDIEPPIQTIAAAEAATGSLTALGTFTYKISWAYSNMISGAGPETKITLTGANRTVNLTNLDAITSTGGEDFGRERIVWRREGEGPWFQFTVIADPSVTIFTDTGAIQPVSGNPLLYVRERDRARAGAYHFIRFWPLTDTDRTVELRYLARPADLVDDSDIPELPDEYHPIIVHKTVLDISAAFDAPQLRSHHERRYQEFLALMSKRTLGGGAQHHQRQSIFGGVHNDFLVTPLTFTE